MTKPRIGRGVPPLKKLSKLRVLKVKGERDAVSIIRMKTRELAGLAVCVCVLLRGSASMELVSYALTGGRQQR